MAKYPEKGTYRTFVKNKAGEWVCVNPVPVTKEENGRVITDYGITPEQIDQMEMRAMHTAGYQVSSDRANGSKVTA